MSDELQKIKEEMDLFASKRGPAVLVQAKVLTVNEVDNTVEVELDGGGTIDDVQLRSIVKTGNKVVCYPKPNSIVLMAAITNSDEHYVVAVEEVDKVVMVKDDLTITITNEVNVVKNGLNFKVGNKVKVEKGADSLKDALVKIIEAVQQIVVLQGNNPNYSKLATALTKINNLLE